MTHVNSNKVALTAMASGDMDQPVVMLNQLRYKNQAEAGHGVDGLTGREAYEVYGKLFAKLHSRFGGEPIWMGRAQHTIIGDDKWDIVILVKYPKRSQFLSMFDDPDYQKIAPIRAAALADSRLIEMTQLLPKI